MNLLIKPASGKNTPELQQQLMPELQMESIPFDAEIESVRQQYCASSGRPLSKVPIDVVQNLITIHGRATTITILQMQQKKYSYDWIWLNHTGLDNLAEHRPAEYFIYATSKLLQDVTLHNELMRMTEAVQAWQHLQSVDEKILIPINELIRRLLAGYKRDKLNKYFKALVNKQVNDIASSIDNLLRFQIELTDLIQTLIAKKKKREMQEKGMTNFRMQRMIQGLSELEIEVGKELNDFDMIDGKSSEIIHALTGTQYRHANIKQRGVQYSQPVIRQKATPFKLNLGDNK